MDEFKRVQKILDTEIKRGQIIKSVETFTKRINCNLHKLKKMQTKWEQNGKLSPEEMFNLFSQANDELQNMYQFAQKFAATCNTIFCIAIDLYKLAPSKPDKQSSKKHS